MIHPPIQILRLFISPGHNFFGRARTIAGDHPQVEVDQMHLLARRGIEGDRYLDYKPNYKGQITFFDDKVYRELSALLGVRNKSVDVFRRNVITSGLDLNELIGQTFEIQGVQFQGTEECRPCTWMNQAFFTGAFEALKGQGGLRARILNDGFLRPSAILPSHQNG